MCRMGHLVAGTVLAALGLWGMIAWWETYGLVMRALVPTALLAVGLLGILSGYSRLGAAARFESPASDDSEEE